MLGLPRSTTFRTQWYDPDFLADLRRRAERLSLAEAENKRIELIVRK
jgi:hypothetical protein